jgi:hypothetical protein
MDPQTKKKDKPKKSDTTESIQPPGKEIVWTDVPKDIQGKCITFQEWPQPYEKSR